MGVKPVFGRLSPCCGSTNPPVQGIDSTSKLIAEFGSGGAATVDLSKELPKIDRIENPNFHTPRTVDWDFKPRYKIHQYSSVKLR